MSINGLSQMLSSNTVREFRLSCGVVLKARKYRIKDYAQAEDEIVRLRGCVKTKVEEVELALASITDKELRKEIISGCREALKEVMTRPQMAYFDEQVNFETSTYGRAYHLMLACRDNSELKELEDYRVLINSLDGDESLEVDTLISWARELDVLKNSDSPTGQKRSQETSSVGDE